MVNVLIYFLHVPIFNLFRVNQMPRLSSKLSKEAYSPLKIGPNPGGIHVVADGENADCTASTSIAGICREIDHEMDGSGIRGNDGNLVRGRSGLRTTHRYP